VATATVLGLLALLVIHPFPPSIVPGTLELTVIDVGQGDSLLIAFPDGRLMLMDAGGIPTFGLQKKTKLDIGEDVVSPYLWSRGIRRLDIVALSHAHDDHAGGMPAILENFRPRELWTGATPDSPTWRSVRDKAIALHIPIKALHQGEAFPGIQILAPPADYIPGRAPRNNDSLVLRLTDGHHSFLLTGDMEKQIEANLVTNGLLCRVDVLKVGHHGSRTSSTPAFLDALHPAFGLISAGYENSYGHPARETLGNLGSRRVEVLRTDRQGLITIRSSGRYLTVTDADTEPAR
jgi:competence protein ComEC